MLVLIACVVIFLITPPGKKFLQWMKSPTYLVETEGGYVVSDKSPREIKKKPMEDKTAHNSQAAVYAMAKLSEDEKEKLDYCKEELNKSESDIVKTGINLIYEKIKQET